MEQTTVAKEKSVEQTTPPQENYVLGQKITPAAIYWMLIALGIINVIEGCFIANINSKVSAICAYFHLGNFH